VHPESYLVVKRIIEHSGKELNELLSDSAYLKSLQPAQFTDDRFGEPTVRDILEELEKPGRDPRPEFKAVKFSDGVESIKDLKEDQVLEGQVTNVTAFGAFVDIGVHQDGLVHISALSDTFVKDPRTVVKAGDIVKVKVMNVDAQRNRIGLSMRLHDKAGESNNERGRSQHSAKPGKRDTSRHTQRNASRQNKQPKQAEPESALALSLQAALTGKSKD